MTRYKTIIILVPELRVRNWAPTLADALQSRLPLPVLLRRPPLTVPPAPPLPLERFERRLAGRPQLGHAEWTPTVAIPLTEAAECEDSLVISALECTAEALCSCLPLVTVIMPLFQHDYRLTGVFAALIGGEVPLVQAVMIAGGEMRCLNSATVALPGRELTSRALATVLARTIVLLRGAAQLCLAGMLPRSEPAPVLTQPRNVTVPRLRRTVTTYLPKIAHRLGDRWRTNDWCIAYRPGGVGDGPPDLAVDRPSFTEIEPENGRFYADPILFRHDDTTAIFFEDFDYRQNRAKISCSVLNEDGTCGPAMEALARPYHLSYPFILIAGGTVLMVPESSANRAIELYEAVRFPDKWRLRSVLLGDIDASDTTLYFDPVQELWWMFAAVCEFDTTAWDTLSLFYAKTIDGPWQAHPGNPVKLDARSSRPAGPLVRRGGRLLRPAQDCSRDYGGAIAWCEIDQLTPDRFRETVIGRSLPHGRYRGLHTYSQAGGYEVVDFARARWMLFGGPKSPSRGRPLRLPSASANEEPSSASLRHGRDLGHDSGRGR